MTEFVKCPYCDKTISVDDSEGHLQTHRNLEFKQRLSGKLDGVEEKIDKVKEID